MRIIRDIAFTRSEPPKSFVWIGFTDEGKYFIRIWNNGWKDVAAESSSSGGGGGGGTVGDITINPGTGLTVSQNGDTFTIGIEQGLYDTIQQVAADMGDWVIGTAEDVDEVCN